MPLNIVKNGQVWAMILMHSACLNGPGWGIYRRIVILSHLNSVLGQDHSENAIGVAATMAHEMGHNFGMNHDSVGCCSASPRDGGCIMAAATG